MTSKKWKILFHIFVITGIFFSGFFVGRNTIEIKTETKIEYIKGDTIEKIIYNPVPEYVEMPIDTVDIIKKCIKDGIYTELWPERIVTEIVEITKEDTTKIIQDWATKRIYDETLFNNDSIGSCNIKAEVQYNRMHLLGYTYTPIIKRETETKYITKTFSPFIGGGYMNNLWTENRTPHLILTGGVFIKENYGVQLQFIHGLNVNNNYLAASFLYKF